MNFINYKKLLKEKLIENLLLRGVIDNPSSYCPGESKCKDVMVNKERILYAEEMCKPDLHQLI
jgi:hypothetical protein